VNKGDEFMKFMIYIYIYKIHQIKNVFHVNLENYLLKWGKVKNASTTLNNYFSFCHHLKLVRGRNAFQNNIKVESLKLMRQYNISLANKTNPTKGLDHGLTTNHFKDMDNVMINLLMCNGRTKLKQLQE